MDVGRHLQDLLEALLLVEALGEAQAGPGGGGRPRSNEGGSGWGRVAPRVVTLNPAPGSAREPVGPGATGCESPLGHNGDVGVNDDCRHYVMQTTAPGRRAQSGARWPTTRCPWPAPTAACSTRPAASARPAGRCPTPGTTPRAPAGHAPPPSALKQVAEQVHPDALLTEPARRGTHCPGRPVELADDPTPDRARRRPAGCSAPRRSAGTSWASTGVGTSDSGKLRRDPTATQGDPVAPASTRLRLPERNPSRSSAT